MVECQRDAENKSAKLGDLFSGSCCVSMGWVPGVLCGRGVWLVCWCCCRCVVGALQLCGSDVLLGVAGVLLMCYRCVVVVDGD